MTTYNANDFEKIWTYLTGIFDDKEEVWDMIIGGLISAHSVSALNNAIGDVATSNIYLEESIRKKLDLLLINRNYYNDASGPGTAYSTIIKEKMSDNLKEIAKALVKKLNRLTLMGLPGLRGGSKRKQRSRKNKRRNRTKRLYKKRRNTKRRNTKRRNTKRRV